MDETGVASEVNALVVGMIGMFFLTLIIILFVVVYQRKLLRQQQKLKAAEEAHQQELLQATIESQEVERDRIGRELHDGVGVMLSTTRMYVDHWKEEEEAQKKEQATERIDKLLGDTIDLVRRVSADLRPVVLETLGLAEAVDDLARMIEDTGQLKVSVDASYQQRLIQKDELNIYRIIQELLTNTLRHAEATRVEISLSSQVTSFRLAYHDDGKGITSSDRLTKGLGLKNIESRVNALSGQLAMESPPEGGTLITIKIDKNEYR